MLLRDYVAWPVSVVQCVQDLNAGVSRRLEDLDHVRHAPVGCGNPLEAVPYFAALGDEVVVRIDHHEAGDASAVRHLANSAPQRR
jgi:hypothetical protein